MLSIWIFLKSNYFTHENNEAPNVEAFSSMTNVDNMLPPIWSCKDVEMMDFIETSERDNEALDTNMVLDNMVEIVSESTFDNVEVIYGTFMVETSTTSNFDSWSHKSISISGSI